MSFHSRFARLAAVAAVAWAGSGAVAAPPAAPAAPPVAAAAPVSAAPMVVGSAVGDPGCATCQHGVAAGGCSTCKHHVLLAKNKTPYQVNLCPGACFGYFQTQWRKWDDVCPYPYLGHGVGDAPRPPGPAVNVPRPGSGELNPPRPLPMDQKDGKGDMKLPTPPKEGGKTGGTLPEIPVVPGGKFGP